MLLPAAMALALFVAVPLSADAADAPDANVPTALAKGQALFNTNCSVCHGVGARGTKQGPPFLDKIYEPNHHADSAFYRAAEMGVRAHHWRFGDMPKIPGVTRDDLTQIIAYIRWLQKQAGIF
ncbi:MAG: cytochrome c [Nitrospirae bacterium]|nr:MAG: cytochrome c [Nitrospirota bacterium]